MSLKNNIGEYHAEKGSNTNFDFSKHNPLEGTTIDDAHKTAGAHINFHNATGKQEIGVIDHFQKGS